MTERTSTFVRHTSILSVPVGIVLMIVLLAIIEPIAQAADGVWRDEKHRATLAGPSIEASFQAGFIYSLKDVATGKSLLLIDPNALPSRRVIFDQALTDLDACHVKTKSTADSIEATYQLPGGDELLLAWTLDPASHDLILRASSHTAKPVEEIRYTLFGCDIREKSLVWINAYGAGEVMNAPWNDLRIGDPQRDGVPGAYPNPLVALFQGKQSGWFLEGRDPRPGPANFMLKGEGNSVTIGMARRFPIAVTSPELFEVRLRTYAGQWEDAVDPYIDWLEHGAGYVAIEKLPAPQAWVNDIRTQSYISIGDYKSLDALAQIVEPKHTFIGRQAEHRPYEFDVGYPDYRITEDARKWIRHARDMGFHVGVHFNSNGVGTEFPELVERFKPGFAVTGKDANGNDTYQSIYQGRLIRCSSAYKPWRDYLIGQMKYSVDAGVDVIYLDESMTAVGKYVVDGVDGMQGMQALMKETLAAYPHVAVETEQFNLLTARYGKLGLSQMPLGHPLSGYLFRRFVRVFPEGVMISPTDSPFMDAFDYWGFMVPGGFPSAGETWPQILHAFDRYHLVPDSRLPRKQFTRFGNHPSGGVIPADDDPIPPDGEKLFGFRGEKGITAYLEKYPTRRGLVLYEPGKQPQWIGTRHYNISTWKGPGVPAYVSFGQYIRDWLIYDDTALYGLDSKVTYIFDDAIVRSPTRFHVTRVPDDFVGYYDGNRRIPPQEVGRDDSFYRLVFAGHGEMRIHVPDDYDVYLDGEKVAVDRKSQLAVVQISASLPKAEAPGYFIALSPEGKPVSGSGNERPSTLLAFKRTDLELRGKWASLPWQRSQDPAKLALTSGDDLHQNVGAYAIYIGKLPAARQIRLRGGYVVNSTTGAVGDGVVLINGKQVLRVPAGEPPYKVQQFDADISSYAGQYVLMEMIPDNGVRGAAADWVGSPQIHVEP